MAVKSRASTTWSGDLASGQGSTQLETSGVAQFDIDWKARSQGGEKKTTPEELLAAAHASCFSMALSHELSQNGAAPTTLTVNVTVTFEAGVGVLGSVIEVEGVVPGIDRDTFATYAEGAKANCPISKALSVDVQLASATLRDGAN